MNDSNKADRVWLITGCSRGLGLALAGTVLAHGYRVIATARQPVTLDHLAARYPETCRVFPLDVTLASQVKDTVARGADAYGRLDIVVNNAGSSLAGALEELGDEQIARSFETNFFGALKVIRTALPILRAQGCGHFVNISAAAAISNYPGFSVYGAAKWALEGLSESLCAELKPLGIHVTIVQPGPFRTEFSGQSMERAPRRMEAYEPTSGRFLRILGMMDGKQPGDPTKAAEAIVAATESDTPPLRLTLGKYAHHKLRGKLAEAEQERAAWESVGLPTGFDGS